MTKHRSTVQIIAEAGWYTVDTIESLSIALIFLSCLAKHVVPVTSSAGTID